MASALRDLRDKRIADEKAVVDARKARRAPQAAAALARNAAERAARKDAIENTPKAKAAARLKAWNASVAARG
jgi:hypothetical protein